MNLLTGPLPASVEIAGSMIQIRTDFRVWAEFERLALDKETQAERLLSLCYPGPVPDPVQALRQAIWFYRLGKAERKQGEGKSAGRCYDFEQDSIPLVASFRAAYGIDLLSEELHWWAFRALMLDLPENSPFCRIVGYRTADLKGMDPKRRKFYAEMKKRYALTTLDRVPAMTLRERDRSMKDYIARRFLESEVGCEQS